MSDALARAVATVPPGRWVVGVSGGADSVTLLCALRAFRPGLGVVVAHLDHQARGSAGAADAAFVEALAATQGVKCVTMTLAQLGIDPPTANVEGVYRAARMRLFRSTSSARGAAGVIVAHHADDRAETALLRLLRGGEPDAIGGLRREARVDGLRIVRPLLMLRRVALEDHLRSIGQAWRTDATNATDAFARNRVRRFLAGRPDLVDPLLRLADAADAVRHWTTRNAPMLQATFPTDALADLPDPLARAAGRRWLRDRGATANDVSIEVVERLIAMCRDGATAARQAFPGAVRVRRRAGRIETPPPAASA